MLPHHASVPLRYARGLARRAQGMFTNALGSSVEAGPSAPLEPTANMVPIVIQNTGQGERAFDIYSRLLQERIVCVHGPVTDAMASLVTAQWGAPRREAASHERCCAIARFKSG